jgi:hypothetical protein
VPLAAFSTLPGWIALAMDAEAVAHSLRRHVPALRGDRSSLLECRPERLRAKDRDWVARYRLTVVEDGVQQEIVLVGTLLPPSQQPGTPPGSDGDPARSRWSCWLPDLRLQLHHEPTDVALPALPVLTEGDATARLLEAVLRGAGYGDVVVTSCAPVVVRYKPGSRCTVLAHVSYAGHDDPRPPSPVVLKTHLGDKGLNAWGAMTALWQRRESLEGIVELAEPLGFLPEERVLVQGPLPEELTLKELARQAFAGGDRATLVRLREELARTGRGLAALHRSGAVHGRVVTFEDEVEEARAVVARLAVGVPDLERAAGPLLSRLESVSREEPAGPLVPAHHDFRPAQVLLARGSVGFIDFDGAAMAEAALDLGRFMAKLRDIGISSLLFTGRPLEGDGLETHLALVDELCEDFLAAYLQEADVSRRRVLLWETCDLFTGLLHAWTKVRLARVQPRLTLLERRLRATGLDGLQQD